MGVYDLGIDRAESKNLVEAHPDLAKELAEQWEGMTREIQQTHQHGVPVKELVLPGESFAFEGRSAFILWPEDNLRKTPQPWVFLCAHFAGISG